MPLLICPDCDKNVSDRAAACPHCGCLLYGNAEPQAVTLVRKTHGLIRWMFVLHLITFVIFVLPILVFIIFMVTAGFSAKSLMMGMY